MGSHRAPLTAEDEEAFLNEALACSLTSSSRDDSHNRRDSTGELEQLQLALALSASEAEARGRPANLPTLRASGNVHQRGICPAASAPPITSAGCSSNGTGADTPLGSDDRQENSVHASREAWYESLTELSLPSTPAAPPTRGRGLDPRSDEELARRLQEKYDCEQDSCVSDSELARALQEQLQQEASGKLQPDPEPEPVADPAEPRRLATRPPTPEDGKPGVRENFFNRLRGSYRASSGTWEGQCAGCGRAVGFGDAVVAGGRRWHAGCFVCVACDKRIKSKYVTHEGCCLHLSCFENIRYPKCNVCSQIIKPGASSRVEYLKEPFWKETYCKRHRDDGTPRCTSCLRLQPQSEDWAVLEDGRTLCFMCLDTTVLDTQAAQPLYREVLKFYEGLGMKLPEQPPLMLVESAVLNEKEEGQGGRHSGPVFHTRGLTLIKHYQVIRTVRSPQRGKEGKRWGVVPEMVPVVSKRATIQGILVIYGLPWLLTGSILAHELMHAWLRLTGVNSLPPQVEEGLCQLMAYLWLEAQETSSSDAQSQRLASYFGYQIRSDQSEVYGDGFRQAHDGFQLLGLQKLLAVVREHKAFPR